MSSARYPREAATLRLRHRIKRAVHKLLGPDGGVGLYAANAAWRAYRALRYKPELGIVRHLLQPGDTAIDVGANGADWTRALSRAVGSNGLVFAFEADPFYARATELAIRILRLRNVRFHAHGLSEAEGVMHLLVRNESGDRLVGVSRLVSGGTAAVIPGRTVPVSLRRLDDVLSENFEVRQVRLLKVDVEGHELSVLRGSEEVLKRARPMVVCEVRHADLHGVTKDGLFHWLETRGFVAFGILLRPLAIRRFGAAAERPDGSAEDVLFVPVERVDTLPARLLFS